MNSIKRLLPFTPSLGKFLPVYIIVTLLASLFGVLNLALLTTVLDVLFGNIEKMSQYAEKPEFKFSQSYIVDLFYHILYTSSKEKGTFRALINVCAVVASSVFFANLFKYLSQLLVANFNIYTLLNLRNAVFNKLMNMNLGYFSNQKKGDIIGKVTADTPIVQQLLSNLVIVYIKEPISIIIFFSFLFAYSYKLTLFTLIIIPVMAFVTDRIVKQLKRQATSSQQAFGRLIGMLDESISGFRIIKSFNASGFIKNKFNHENTYYANVAKSMAKRSQMAAPANEFLGVFIILTIVLYGGSLVLSDQSELSDSQFMGYVAILSQAVRPLKSLSNSLSGIRVGTASADRVLSIFDAKNNIEEKPNAPQLNDFKDSIALKNLHFSYGDKEVLHNVNFEIKKGSTVALVGPSGGGKSTISDLLPRFYDPAAGEVLIDGTNIKEFNIESLRAQMGIVSQEAILFNDSILNNIAFGVENPDPEAVEEAAKIANAHEFISKMEKGYLTNIGDRGAKLSGGQRQRISIARAVLKNPPILILDEATSALDTESEKLVQDALERLMKNRTTLIIAHRLSTIRNADKILVVKDGSIVEEGSHDELIFKENGIYRSLKQMQDLN